MNKTELVHAIAESAKLSKVDAGRALDATLEAIKDSLQNGVDVPLIGFGTFTVRSRVARKGRNPKTKEEIVIPAAKVPAFRPGKTLKDAVN